MTTGIGKKKLCYIFTFWILVAGLFFTAGDTEAYLLSDLTDGTGRFFDIGDKRFSSWEILSNPDNLDLDLIEITADPAALNPGLIYTALGGVLSVTDTNVIGLNWSFNVDIISGPLRIKDNSLEILDFRFDPLNFGGAITIDETVYDSLSNPIADKSVIADFVFGNSLSDYADFPLQSSITVETRLVVGDDVFGDIDDTTSLLSFEQRFSQAPIPEPTTITLLGIGLTGLAGFRRKLKK